MPNRRHFAFMPAAAVLLFSAVVPAAAKIVSEAAMVSHCAEAAATELGVMMNDVLTLPAERNSGTHVACTVSDRGPIEGWVEMN